MTSGFDVFVHEVIAAITTSPSANSNASPSNSVGTGAEAIDPGAATRPRDRLPTATSFATARSGPAGAWDRPATAHRRHVELEVGAVDDVAIVVSPHTLHLAVLLDGGDMIFLAAGESHVSMVRSSTGKKPTVAPYSGHMLAMVARLANGMVSMPGPWNSTNLPTTPCSRSISVTRSTRSVAVAPSDRTPVSLNPTTSGSNIEIGWPTMTASASMPPTPQPTTPRPLIMVVCESVPTSESG